MKPLYKKRALKPARVWEVSVSNSFVHVSYGVVGGKRTSKITQCFSKNAGKVNETTPEQQAELHAKSLYKKKMQRDCYVTDLSHESPYVEPMLALDATKVGHRINWMSTQYGQAKLDGVRGLHVQKHEGVVQSRKGTFYKTPRLYEQLEELRCRLGLPKDDQYLDGEIYKQGIPLGKINGAAKKKCELTDQLEFHVFDLACKQPLTYFERRLLLSQATPGRLKTWGLDKLVIVPSVEIQLLTFDKLHDDLVMNGFEGLMIRDSESLYDFGERSDGMFKYKKFEEAEFTILAIRPDKDGQAIITYKSPEGHAEGKHTFDSRPKGTDQYREELVKDSKEYVGKLGTVRYFQLTEYGVPQFPVTVMIGADK